VAGVKDVLSDEALTSLALVERVDKSMERLKRKLTRHLEGSLPKAAETFYRDQMGFLTVDLVRSRDGYDAAAEFDRAKSDIVRALDAIAVAYADEEGLVDPSRQMTTTFDAPSITRPGIAVFGDVGMLSGHREEARIGLFHPADTAKALRGVPHAMSMTVLSSVVQMMNATVKEAQFMARTVEQMSPLKLMIELERIRLGELLKPVDRAASVDGFDAGLAVWTQLSYLDRSKIMALTRTRQPPGTDVAGQFRSLVEKGCFAVADFDASTNGSLIGLSPSGL
jgi:hypothetical protein